MSLEKTLRDEALREPGKRVMWYGCNTPEELAVYIQALLDKGTSWSDLQISSQGFTSERAPNRFYIFWTEPSKSADCKTPSDPKSCDCEKPSQLCELEQKVASLEQRVISSTAMSEAALTLAKWKGDRK